MNDLLFLRLFLFLVFTNFINLLYQILLKIVSVFVFFRFWFLLGMNIMYNNVFLSFINLYFSLNLLHHLVIFLLYRFEYKYHWIIELLICCYRKLWIFHLFNLMKVMVKMVNNLDFLLMVIILSFFVCLLCKCYKWYILIIYL